MSIVRLIDWTRPLMVLKNAFVAVLCSGFLLLGGPALADEYRPDEFLSLDLSKAVLSPKRLGPAAEFAPVSVEAKADRNDARADRKIVVRTTRVKQARVESPVVRPTRVV